MQNQSRFGRFIEIPLDTEPLYFFPYEQRYRTMRHMHYHNGVEVGLCRKGEGAFFAGDKVYHFGQGDVSVVPAGVPHIAQSPDQSPSEWYFLTFDPQTLDISFPGSLSRHILSDHGITRLMQVICDELTDRREGADEMAVLLLRALGIRLAREASAQQEPARCAQLQALLPALSHISQHYAQEITIPQLSAMCYLSVSHFRRLFKSCTGLSPIAYLCYVRLKMAAILLRSTDRPIADIAMETGFETLSSFNRNFHEYYHMPPRTWRKGDDIPGTI